LQLPQKLKNSVVSDAFDKNHCQTLIEAALLWRYIDNRGCHTVYDGICKIPPAARNNALPQHQESGPCRCATFAGAGGAEFSLEYWSLRLVNAIDRCDWLARSITRPAAPH
jgi:hypothetical protein